MNFQLGHKDRHRWKRQALNCITVISITVSIVTLSFLTENSATVSSVNVSSVTVSSVTVKEQAIIKIVFYDTDQLDGVDVVPLEPLPDADLGVDATEADDVAGGVGEGGDLAVVRQDGVGARARQQVPHADHAVLGGIMDNEIGVA